MREKRWVFFLLGLQDEQKMGLRRGKKGCVKYVCVYVLLLWDEKERIR